MEQTVAIELQGRHVEMLHQPVNIFTNRRKPFPQQRLHVLIRRV
jgi:hypothetical protein